MFVKSRTFWFGTVLALVGFVTFVSLGAWQWGRADWKARYLSAYETALAADPLPLREALARVRDADDSGVPIPVRATGTGSYDPMRTVLLDNQRRGAAVGVLVLTLFHPTDESPPLLVARGWLPLDPGKRSLPSVETPSTVVTVSGLLRPPPSTGIRFGPALPSVGHGGLPLLAWLDLDALGAAWGLSLPHYVLELEPSSPAGFRRDANPLPNTLQPEQHRGYAVQWWGLAVTVAVIWVVLVRRARRRDGPSTPRS